MITNLPDIRPSLLLDFANSGGVDPRIQCTRASTATCFGPDGKLRTVAANVPRIDYDPVTGKCFGLLVEESRTNLLISSSAFGAAGWTLSSAILQETAITSSLGTKLQKFVIPTGYSASNSSIRHIDITKSASSITYTLTVIAKAGENNFLRLLPRDVATSSNSVDARFNLTTGESFSSTSSGTYNLVSTSMRHLGDGLYECTVVFTTGPETGIRVQILQMLNNGTAIGNDIDGIYLAGSQLEVGAFPTSYIPTESTAVTRAADALSVEMPDAAFSVIADLYDSQSAPVSPVLSIAGATGVKNWRLVLINNATLRVDRTTVGNANVAGTSLPLGTTTGNLKVSLAVSGIDTQIAALGTKYLAGTYSDMADSFVLPRRLHFGKSTTAPSGYIGARRFKSVTVYNTALTQAQLQRLTA